LAASLSALPTRAVARTAETGTRLRESDNGVIGKRDMGPTAILQPSLLKMKAQVIEQYRRRK
jgi:hypothetical protein